MLCDMRSKRIEPEICVCKICQLCGQEYIGKKQSRFCSAHCKVSAWWLTREIVTVSPAKPVVNCRRCRKPLIITGRTKKEYCSSKCKKADNTLPWPDTNSLMKCTCGKRFTPKHNRDLFCSPPCWEQFLASGMKH